MQCSLFISTFNDNIHLAFACVYILFYHAITYVSSLLVLSSPSTIGYLIYSTLSVAVQCDTFAKREEIDNYPPPRSHVYFSKRTNGQISNFNQKLKHHVKAQVMVNFTN